MIGPSPVLFRRVFASLIAALYVWRLELRLTGKPCASLHSPI